MTIIIGIDPGSRFTGYGVIRCEGNQNFYLDSGCLRITSDTLAAKLQQIFAGLHQIIQHYQPEEAAIEQVFMHDNPGSALKLGQARGAAIVALNIPITEYSARQVKQAIVGSGAAKKQQVQHMIQSLLGLRESLQADEADALAIALCHAHTRLVINTIGISPKLHRKKNQWRNFIP